MTDSTTTDKKEVSKAAYIVPALLVFGFIIIYIAWFYRSYDNGTGFFTPYEPSDNGNLVKVPNFPGNELFYETNSDVMEKKAYMLDIALASLPPSEFTNDNNFSDNDPRWGLIIVVIIALFILVGMFAYVGFSG